MTSLDMYFKHVDTALIDSEALPWVPFEPYTPDAHVKLLKADPVRGEIIALLKDPASMELPRHHHPGTVIVYTLAGSSAERRVGQECYSPFRSRGPPYH